VTVLTNNGQAAFGWAAALPVDDGPAGLVALDLTGDGWIDLAVANQNANTSPSLPTPVAADLSRRTRSAWASVRAVWPRAMSTATTDRIW